MSVYIVKAGDTLSTIARDVMGSIDLWQYLASINNIPSPYVIYPGQELKTDVAEITGRKWPKGLIIGGAIAAAAAIYFRKEIISFFKSLT